MATRARASIYFRTQRELPRLSRCSLDYVSTWGRRRRWQRRSLKLVRMWRSEFVTFHCLTSLPSRLFVLHDGHVAQIAVELVGIEAEAHHEAVGDLEAAEVHRNLHDAARVAVQESTHRQRIRRPAGQGLQQVAQGEAGID